MRSVIKISTVSLITVLAVLILQCESKDKFYLPDLPEQICAAGLIDIDDTLHYAICNSSIQASSKKIFFEKSFQSIDSLGSDYLRDLNFRISDGKEDIFTEHINEPTLNPAVEIPSDLRFESGRKYFFRAGERDAPDISAECVVPELPPELTLVSLKTWFDIQNFPKTEVCFNNNRGHRESTYTRRYAEIEFTFNNTDPESYYALFLIGSPQHPREDIFGIGLVAPSFINYDVIESNTYGFKQTFIGGLTIYNYCRNTSFNQWGTDCKSAKLYTYFIDGNKIPGGNCIIKISTYWDNIQYMPSFIEYFRVRLMSIPKEAYLFYKSLYISTAQVDDPFAQPVNVNGNVVGGNGVIALCRSRDLIVYTGQTGGRFDPYF
jgi:hypothetical protein